MLSFKGYCDNFKEAGDRIVAVVDHKVEVYPNKKLLHTCAKQCGNKHSLVAEGNKAYFASKEGEKSDPENHLIELNLQTFEAKQLLPNIFALSGVPSSESLVAVSKKGLLHASRNRSLNLKLVFKEMDSDECIWTAVVSSDHLAVVAGHTAYHLLNGQRLHKKYNFFLLVNLANLSVGNSRNPYGVEWEGIPIV